MNSRCISNPAHQTVQRINFADQVSFTETTDCRVTGHHPNSLSLMGNESGFSAMSCSGRRSFAAGMSTTDNNDIK